MQLTFLGTGTSQGVPVIACDCSVCSSKNLKDKRLRTSVMIEHNDKSIVIDTGPDFRQQMLRENVKDIEAVVYTHEHKDHTAGMDDIRAFNYFSKKDIPLYANKLVEKSLRRDFHYAFGELSYPGVPKVHIINIEKDTKFEIADIPFQTIEVMHYKLPVLGFRIKDLCYITDVNYISEEEKEKIKGCKILILSALRIEKHISHFNLQEALEVIAEIKPEKAYLTHISHQLGEHNKISEELPQNVFLAYDGLKLDFN